MNCTAGGLGALPRAPITTHVATYERLITPARRATVIDCNCVRGAEPANSCGRSWPVRPCPAFVDGCYALPQPFVRVSVLPCPSPGRASSQMAIVLMVTGRRTDWSLRHPARRPSCRPCPSFCIASCPPQFQINDFRCRRVSRIHVNYASFARRLGISHSNLPDNVHLLWRHIPTSNATSLPYHVHITTVLYVSRFTLVVITLSQKNRTL